MKIILFAVMTFILVDVLIVIYVIYKHSHKKLSVKVVKEIQSSWKRIIRQKDQRHSIMDADKLLDYALFQYGMKGSLGSKLKKSTSRFKDINAVWAAHKIRNNIAHQMNYKVTERVYKKAMMSFKQAFKDLKIF